MDGGSSFGAALSEIDSGAHAGGYLDEIARLDQTVNETLQRDALRTVEERQYQLDLVVR